MPTRAVRMDQVPGSRGAAGGHNNLGRDDSWAKQANWCLRRGWMALLEAFEGCIPSPPLCGQPNVEAFGRTVLARPDRTKLGKRQRTIQTLRPYDKIGPPAARL
jgi:hypothetical protein